MQKSLERSLQKSLSETLANPAALSSRLRSEGVECPKCSKRSIVKRSANTFDCLNCNFHKELPSVDLSSDLSALGNPLIHPLANRRLADRPLHYTTGHPHNLRSPLYPSLDSSESGFDTGHTQPFVFAAIAVIIGIVLL